MKCKIIRSILFATMLLLSGFLLNSCQEKDVVEVTEIVFTNLSTGKKTLTVGEEFKIKWVVVPEQLQETAEIFWETSDRKVAKVKKGVIEATGPGEATITATSGKAKTSVLVKVDAVQVESLEFPHLIQVYQDATVEVKFNNVEPEDASLTTVEWEVETYESGGNATVEADVDCIYVTGTEEGIVTLYGRVDGVVIGLCEIEIRKRIPVESVTVTLSKSSVQFGESLTVSTYVSPSNASLKDVNITCSPASYVTVEGNTITAGETAGMVTVYAMADGVTGSAEFEIVPPPLELTIDCSDLKYYNFLSPDGSLEDYPESAQLTLKANYDIDLSSAVWKSSNPAIVSVDANGLVKGVGHGWAIISATVDGVEKSIIVRSVMKSSLSLCIYEYNSAGDTKIRLTSLQAPYNMIGAYCADPAFINDPDRYSMDHIYRNIQISSCTGPFTAHMEGDYLVVNASSAGTGSITLSIPGGKSLNVPVTMKVTSLTFIGHDSGKNYGTVQKGGSLTITRVDEDPDADWSSFEAIEVWRNVGSSKDDTSLYDHGYLSWESNIITGDPFDYGYLTRTSGTHVIRLTEFDPEFSVTLTVVRRYNP